MRKRTLDQLVSAVVAAAPPLTDAQRARLAGLLGPVPSRREQVAA